MLFKREQASEKKSGLFVGGYVRSFVSDGLGGVDLKSKHGKRIFCGIPAFTEISTYEVTLSASTTRLSDGAVFTFENSTFTFLVVPEPSSSLLIAGLFFSLLDLRRREV